MKQVIVLNRLTRNQPKVFLRVWTVGCLATLVSAWLGCELGEEDVTPLDPEIVTPSLYCGDLHYQDPGSEASTVFPEVYYPKALAARLQHYGAGLTPEATNCAEARAQSASLMALRQAHPELEGDEGEPDVPDAPADADIEDGNELRVWDGRAASTYNTAVVYLRFTQPGGATPNYACTGTIISARHVLTAAHCLPGAGTQKIFWESVEGDSGSTFNVKAHIHPDFAGGVQGSPLEPAYDLALLEIPVRSETEVMTSSANRLRIYTGDTTIGQELRIRGYGYRSNDADDLPVDEPVERPYNDEKVSIAAHSGGYFRGWSTSRVRACQGDSGGPAIEMGTYSSPILWGAFSGFVSSPGFGRCPDTSKSMYWAKTNVARTWIQNRMRELYGANFVCPSFGNAGQTYRRCW